MKRLLSLLRERKDVGKSREKDRHENGRGGFADRAPQEEAPRHAMSLVKLPP